MHCLDNKVELSGDYDTANAKQLVAVLEKCSGRSTCKSEEDIKSWIAGKYVITIENTWTFRQHEYRDKKLQAEAKFNWFAMSSNNPIDKSRMFTVQNVKFEDSILQIEGWTARTADFFKIDNKIDRPYELDKTTAYMVRYEMNSNMIKQERVVYSIFDYMGDIGGFNEALNYCVLFVLWMIHFQPLNLHLVKKLFSYGKPKDKADVEMQTIGLKSKQIPQVKQGLEIGTLSYLKFCLFQHLPEFIHEKIMTCCYSPVE